MAKMKYDEHMLARALADNGYEFATVTLYRHTENGKLHARAGCRKRGYAYARYTTEMTLAETGHSTSCDCVRYKLRDLFRDDVRTETLMDLWHGVREDPPTSKSPLADRINGCMAYERLAGRLRAITGDELVRKAAGDLADRLTKVAEQLRASLVTAEAELLVRIAAVDVLDKHVLDKYAPYGRGERDGQSTLVAPMVAGSRQDLIAAALSRYKLVSFYQLDSVPGARFAEADQEQTNGRIAVEEVWNQFITEKVDLVWNDFTALNAKLNEPATHWVVSRTGAWSQPRAAAALDPYLKLTSRTGGANSMWLVSPAMAELLSRYQSNVIVLEREPGDTWHVGTVALSLLEQVGGLTKDAVVERFALARLV